MVNDMFVKDSIWNTYLKKYSNKYQLVHDENNIWQIKCKYGNIQLHSFSKKELCYVSEFKTKQKTTFQKKKIPKFCDVTQGGDFDFVCKFPENRLEEVVDLFYVRKRRILSEEHKQKLRDNIKRAIAIKTKNNTIECKGSPQNQFSF